MKVNQYHQQSRDVFSRHTLALECTTQPLTTDYDPVSFYLSSSGRHSHNELLYRSNQKAFSTLTLKCPFVGTVNNEAKNHHSSTS